MSTSLRNIWNTLTGRNINYQVLLEDFGIEHNATYIKTATDELFLYDCEKQKLTSEDGKTIPYKVEDSNEYPSYLKNVMDTNDTFVECIVCSRTVDAGFGNVYVLWRYKNDFVSNRVIYQDELYCSPSELELRWNSSAPESIDKWLRNINMIKKYKRLDNKYRKIKELIFEDDEYSEGRSRAYIRKSIPKFEISELEFGMIYVRSSLYMEDYAIRVSDSIVCIFKRHDDGYSLHEVNIDDMPEYLSDSLWLSTKTKPTKTINKLMEQLVG